MRIIFLIFICSFTVLAEPYELRKVNTPENTEFSLGGLCFDHSGGLVASIRNGEVWNLREGKWHMLASGLQEPMALVQSWREGEYFALQRAELTKIVDEDQNGSFDLFETFVNSWQFTGNKNDFAMALTTDVDGNFYLGTSLSLTDDGYANAQIKNRGLIYKVDYVGEKTVFASGAYKPVGATFNEAGDLFVSENQGGYIAANCIFHVEQGDFLGNPVSLKDDPSKQSDLRSIMRKSGADRVKALNDLRKKPALYLPDSFSGSGICYDLSKGKFGPFADQLFITDFDNSELLRAFLEKVNGVYQGAVFTFMSRDGINALRPLFSEQGELYLGKGGDGCCAGSGLYKVSWKEQSFFDVKAIQVTKSGFKFLFTEPVNEESFTKALNVKSYYYEYTSRIDAKKLDEKKHLLSDYKISKNGLELEFRLSDMSKERVYQFNYEGLQNQSGKTVKFSRAYYTLNQLMN